MPITLVKNDPSIGNSAIGGASAASEPIIADGSVTTAKIADDAVTTAKIADDAITHAKIAKPAEMGSTRMTLLCRQNAEGNDTTDGVTVNTPNENDPRPVLATQTPAWTLSGKSTDWLKATVTGTCYFGVLSTAQPICADVELWVRWKGDGESFQSWDINNSRVEAVDLGFDKSLIIKLSAGGQSNAHVDATFASSKFAKLSGIGASESSDIQFTLAFRRQNPSPSYTARGFFLTIEIVDGNRVLANY